MSKKISPSKKVEFEAGNGELFVADLQKVADDLVLDVRPKPNGRGKLYQSTDIPARLVFKASDFGAVFE